MYVVAASLSVATLWGILPIVHKHLLNTYSPQGLMLSTSWIYAFCAICYALYHRDIIKQDIKKLTTMSIITIISVTVLCSFIGMAIYFTALSKHDSFLVSALVYVSPVVTLLLAYFVLHEKITVIAATGVVLIVTGVMLLAKHTTTTH